MEVAGFSPFRPILRIEYRVWNPFRSKLGAGIVGGIGACPVKPGAKVLYLGGASGTTVSHVSDMVGPEGGVGPGRGPGQVSFWEQCGSYKLEG